MLSARLVVSRSTATAGTSGISHTLFLKARMRAFDDPVPKVSSRSLAYSLCKTRHRQALNWRCHYIATVGHSACIKTCVVASPSGEALQLRHSL